jgi:2-aminoadipate transaminase
MDPRFAELQHAAAERDDVLGLAGGLPAEDLLPKAELARALAEVTRQGDALQYGWPEGTEQLRTWIAARLAVRGARVDPERIIVTTGAQQALAIAARVLRGAIEVGDATYAGALDAFKRAGARVVPSGGDALYAIEGVANPQGVDLLDRAAILAGTRPVVVDEAYVDLRFDARVARPLLADAPERVWHVGTISKTIAPGLRVGWLIPPRAHHDAALELKQASDLQTPGVSQAALARLLATIDYDALVARARDTYATRADACMRALRRHAPDLAYREPEGGFSIWVETDIAGDDLAFMRAALAAGVMVDPGSAFRPGPHDTLAFRLCYSHVAAGDLDEAIRRVGRAVASLVRSS